MSLSNTNVRTHEHTTHGEALLEVLFDPVEGMSEIPSLEGLAIRQHRHGTLLFWKKPKRRPQKRLLRVVQFYLHTNSLHRVRLA